MKKLKICNDCKFCSNKNIEGNDFSTCNCPKQRTEMDYSTGKRNFRWEYCSIQRTEVFPLDIIMGTCGKRGRFFELKEGEIKK
jgi:hypothetical protein